MYLYLHKNKNTIDLFFRSFSYFSYYFEFTNTSKFFYHLFSLNSKELSFFSHVEICLPKYLKEKKYDEKMIYALSCMNIVGKIFFHIFICILFYSIIFLFQNFFLKLKMILLKKFKQKKKKQIEREYLFFSEGENSPNLVFFNVVKGKSYFL